MKEEILRVQNVKSIVKGITYLDNINFNIYKGEIMGLIPLNNHGKDRLISLLFQNQTIEFGRIYFDERLVNYYEHSDYSFNKVAIIDSNIRLVEDLSVVDNLYVLNNKFTKYIINEKEVRKKSLDLLSKLNIDMDISKNVRKLNNFERVAIELIRAVINDSKIIILNEISNFLTVDELNKFQGLIKHYTNDGISFLYMANHHEEAFQICNRVSLFENGRVVKVINEKNFSDEILKPYIIEFDSQINMIDYSDDRNNNFKITGLYSENLRNVNFSVNKGECITILGVDNKAVDEIEDILTGRKKYEKGIAKLEDKVIEDFNLKTFIDEKIVFIPENPVEELLFFDLSVFENLTFLLSNEKKRQLLKDIKSGKEYIYDKSFNIKKLLEEENISNLETDILYDLVYFKIILFKPKVVFITQPFANADMYLRARIISLINLFKKEGISVIILAVSLSDTLNVSDRLLILENKTIKIEYSKDYFTKKQKT